MTKIEKVLWKHGACDEGIKYARAHADQTPEEFFDGCRADDAVWSGMRAIGFFCGEFSSKAGVSCLCNMPDADLRWLKVRENFIEACRGE